MHLAFYDGDNGDDDNNDDIMENADVNGVMTVKMLYGCSMMT